MAVSSVGLLRLFAHILPKHFGILRPPDLRTSPSTWKLGMYLPAPADNTLAYIYLQREPG